MTLEAIISGGGIGGLATAAALGRRGWRVTVYESRPGLRVAGSGIYLWSNGLAVLSEIGAYQRAMRNAFPAEGIEQRDHTGQVLVPALLPPGLRVLAVARSDLLAGLEAAARDAGARIVTGAEVVAAEADGTLVFANGDRAHADLVIGCDGIASPVRRALGLELHRQRAQEGALRSIVGATQQELPPSARGRCIEIWNGTRRLLITPINTEEIYLALTCREDDDQARDTRVQPCWSESFPEWSFLLDRIDRSQVLWNVYTIVHSKRWSAGRACILGDAAHAQPPNLGQGGGMAMQNGLALAAHMANVRDPRDVPEALGAWEAATRPLTDECQRWACLWGELANIPNEARARIVRGAFSEPWVLSRITAASGSSPIAATDWRPASAR